MKNLTITSPESLDTAVADVIRLKIVLTQLNAERDKAVVLVQKKHEADIADQIEEIAAAEGRIRDYCEANRGALFPVTKSRETQTAVFGFELTPPRVETANKKIKWADVLERLKRTKWGQAYLRVKESIDKEALLADRQTLTPEQCTAAGLQFAQDEQWFLRPKPETAADTKS